MSTESYFSTTEVAATLRFESAISLSRLLKDMGWKHKDSDAPAAKAVEAGVLAVKIGVPRAVSAHEPTGWARGHPSHLRPL